MKTKKKLLLVYPVNPRIHSYSLNKRFCMPPLGLGIIAALTPPTWDVILQDENMKSFEFQDADLVGITACTSTATRAYEIAGMYRERGVPTVLGGMHASMLPDEAQRYVDTLVLGEAESVWPALIADFEAGNIQQVYQGKRVEPDEMVQPRHDLFKSYLMGAIQTTRGCPYDCEFCACTVFYGNRYRQRPVNDVLDELEAVPQKWIFFAEDNLVPYGKQAEERALQLFQGMIERKIKKKWTCYASMNFADSEQVLEAAAKAGCRAVILGIEAEDDAALGEMNKNLNIRIGVNNFEDIFCKIQKHGITVHGEFIFGLDSDTPEKLRRRTDYILSSSIDVMEVSLFTPLPGTRLMKRLEKDRRLLFTDYPNDWDYYDMEQVTFEPALMSVDEFTSVTQECVQRLYSYRSLFSKFRKTLFNTHSLYNAIACLLLNYTHRKVLYDAFSKID